jgi:hypothetical protein
MLKKVRVCDACMNALSRQECVKCGADICFPCTHNYLVSYEVEREPCARRIDIPLCPKCYQDVLDNAEDGGYEWKGRIIEAVLGE